LFHGYVYADGVLALFFDFFDGHLEYHVGVFVDG